jgi:hypothetical protein
MSGGILKTHQKLSRIPIDKSGVDGYNITD